MKKLFALWYMNLLFVGALFAQTETVDETNWAVIVILIIIAGAEIILRAIPCAKWPGLLGLVIILLKFLSVLLNNKEEN